MRAAAQCGPAGFRRELPPGGAGEDRRRCATLRRSPGISSAACRPTRRAPSPRSSTGCTASTGCRSPSGCGAAAHHAPPLNVCLQVNLAGEPSKAGVTPAELPALAAAVAQLPRLRLRGLMCIPPEEQDPQRQRGWFAALRRELEALNAQRRAARYAFHGHERRLRLGHPGGRDHRARRHGAVWPAARPMAPRQAAT